MEKDRAIQKDYMTVGKVAKKMGVTVRTLQYYDKEGLLSPSAESKGGRRLYTDKDIVKLHQILSLKSLGFSLDDIKNHLNSLDTPADVAKALTDQGDLIRKKIEGLSESLTAIETLKVEVLQMQSVDFKKYADIIVNLQMNNEFYWIIKHMDDATLNQVRNRFDKKSALAMMKRVTDVFEEAIKLQRKGILPESEKGQKLAKDFWDMIMEFTGGDMSMLLKLMETEESIHPEREWGKEFIEPALEVYFTKSGIDPFQGGVS